MVESALAMIEFLRPLFIVTAVVFDVIVVVMLIIAPLLSGSSSCVARSVEIALFVVRGVLTFDETNTRINLCLLLYISPIIFLINCRVRPVFELCRF